jgi:hypothetical protein
VEEVEEDEGEEDEGAPWTPEEDEGEHRAEAMGVSEAHVEEGTGWDRV